MKNRIFYKVQDQINEEFQIFGINKDGEPSLKSTNITYEELQEEILRLIRLTKNEIFIGDNYHSFFIYGPTGVGKCFAKGTPVLMFDGSVKNVEDITDGDLLMGPDSKPRKVKSTTFGKENMYDIISAKGDTYTVNESHILSLKLANDKLVNISVKDYLKKSKAFKRCAKGYRTGVEWGERETSPYLDPHFLGTWLGDGHNKWYSITNVDEEIINYLYNYSSKIKEDVIQYTYGEKTPRYNIKFGSEKKSRIVEQLHRFDLIKNKHIPELYKINSRKKRLELLAGLLDASGHYSHKGFSITQKNKRLAKDILFLARSLGFAAYLKLKKKSAHKRHSVIYYEVSIHGDCSTIPTKINRKSISTKKHKKDVLVTGIKVKKVGVGNYYGFELEGDKKRFLLGDFTVAHNTEITEQLAKQEDCIYHKLEIQKVPVEILQGFPYLENMNGDGKVALLAPSTILPPSNDDRTWVLHFDEFNKADADKMAAVMNLVLTGELGGSASFDKTVGKSVKYRLPRKTVIIGTGNPKIQDNVENMNVVNQMDTATSERWHRTAFLGYNAESWMRVYASKPFVFKGQKLSSRIPGIVLNYILDKTLDEGNNEVAFTIPIISGSEEGAETERTTSPRAWTLVANAMIMDGFEEFCKLNIEKTNELEKLANEYGTNSFDMYMKDPVNQMRLLSKQVYEFGLNGKDIVKEIISRYIYFAENRVLPEDVLFRYEKVRERIKKLSEKRGVILYLLLGVGYYLDTAKEFNDIETSAIFISTYFEDNSISAEDIVAFIQILYLSNNIVCKDMHDKLFDISEKYRASFSGYFYTGEKELD